MGFYQNKKKSFSQRNGLVKVREKLQVDELDVGTRNMIWNEILMYFKVISDYPIVIRRMRADLFELPSVALLVVSDNSASGAALVGRTEEQQKQYDFGRMVVLPDMVLTLAKE